MIAFLQREGTNVRLEKVVQDEINKIVILNKGQWFGGKRLYGRFPCTCSRENRFFNKVRINPPVKRGWFTNYRPGFCEMCERTERTVYDTLALSLPQNGAICVPPRRDGTIQITGEGMNMTQSDPPESRLTVHSQGN